jgi:predicted transcriptional regulator
MAKKVLSENAAAILTFLQGATGDFTAADLAEELNLDKKVVNGVVTGMARASKDLVYRDTNFDPKVIRLTEKGKTFDPATETAE